MTDAKNTSQRPRAFFDWRSELPTWAKDRSVIYVYRLHPVLLEPEEDPNGKPWEQERSFIDKISGEEQLTDELDFLNRYGCGSYRLQVNDTSGIGKAGNVCTLHIQNVGGGNYRSNPPTDRRVDDVAQVDVNHPNNKAYVGFLRAQGKLDNQEGKDMATVTVLEKLVESNERLAEKAMAKDKPTPPPPDKSGEMIDAAFKIADRLNSNTPPLVTQTTDGIVTGQLLLKLIDKLDQPKVTTADPEVAELRRQVAELTTKQFEVLSGQVKQLMTALETRASGSPYASIKDGAAALRDMKSVIDEISGGNNAPNPVEDLAAAGPPWLRAVGPYIPHLLQFGNNLLNAITMSVMSRANPSAPMPPPMANGMPMPVPPVQGPPTTAMVPAQQYPPEMIALLNRVGPMVLGSLTMDLSGTDLADGFIDKLGEDLYQQVVMQGPDQILQTLYGFQPIAIGLKEFPPDSVRALILEFCNPQFETPEGGELNSPGEPPPTA